MKSLIWRNCKLFLVLLSAIVPLTLLAGERQLGPEAFALNASWTTEGDKIIGHGKKRSEQFLQLKDRKTYNEVAFSADVTITETTGAGWKIAGISLYQSEKMFWHLALVEAPQEKGEKHTIELAEMYEGTWHAQEKLPAVHWHVPDREWKYGEIYRLQIKLMPGFIEGTVTNSQGKVMFDVCRKLSQQSVRSGSLALHNAGFKTAFSDITLNEETIMKSGSVIDFESEENQLAINRPQERGQDIEQVSLPNGSGQAAKISWDSSKFRYVEMLFSPLRFVGDFEQATIRLKARGVSGSPVNRINLRLTDSNGEAFQWSYPVSLKSGQWQEVVFNITPQNFTGCWGGDKNKEIDMPALLYGLVIEFTPNTGKSHCWIDDITYNTAGGAEVKCKSQLASFDESEAWSLRAYGGGGHITQGRETSLTGDAHTYVLSKRLWGLKRFNIKPESIQLKVHVQEGSPAATLVFRGADNKVVSTPAINLQTSKDFYAIPVGEQVEALKLPLEIRELKIVSGEKKPISLNLDSLSWEYFDFPINAIKVEVTTGNGLHIWRADRDEPLGMSFMNKSYSPVSFQADIVLKNFFGDEISCTKTFQLPAQETQHWNLPKTPSDYGIWWVRYTLTDIENKGSSRNGRLSFAYMDPAGPTSGQPEPFLFGMCTHTERWSRRDQELEALAIALCGARIVRTGVTWGGIQPAPDTWNWTLMDRLVRLYGKHNIQLQYLFAYTPRWAAPEETRDSANWFDWSRATPDIDAWGEYISKTAERYKNNIKYWEVWNEPDLGFFRECLEDYLAMLKTAYQEVKKVDPNLKVMTGGFASMAHPQSKEGFHRGVLEKGKGYFDIHAYHEHGTFGPYSHRVDAMFLPMRKSTNTDKPWYANETGVASVGGTEGAEIMQAETLYKKFLFAWARGAIGYNWYDLRNDGYDPNYHEHTYGIFTNDFYPKAGYPVYNTLATFFKGMHFDRQLKFDGELWAFVFKDNDRIIIPAWNENPSAAAQHVVISTDATEAEQVDIMGNTSPARIIDQKVVLAINQTPSALNLKGASQVELMRKLVGVHDLQGALPGRTLPVEANFLNPFDSQRNYRVFLQLPDGIGADVQSTDVKLGANSESTVQFTLHIADDIEKKQGKAASIKFSYELEGTPWRGQINVPINIAKALSSQVTGQPDFTIGGRHEDVFSIFQADPTKSHLVWKGPDDLSAKVWLGEDGSNLLLRIEVTDDVHRQEYKGGVVYQGDNIQVGLRFPDQPGYFWEIGLTRLDNGQPEVHVWSAPKVFKAGQTAEAIQLETARENTTTTYRAEIPLAAIGADKEDLARGFQFNILVNDDDGGGREGWVRLAPGIGEKKDASAFPFVVFRE